MVCSTLYVETYELKFKNCWRKNKNCVFIEAPISFTVFYIFSRTFRNCLEDNRGTYTFGHFAASISFLEALWETDVDMARRYHTIVDIENFQLFIFSPMLCLKNFTISKFNCFFPVASFVELPFASLFTLQLHRRTSSLFLTRFIYAYVRTFMSGLSLWMLLHLLITKESERKNACLHIYWTSSVSYTGQANETCDLL